MDELLGERIKLSGEDRFYRVSDRLLACGEALGIHLRECGTVQPQPHNCALRREVGFNYTENL